MEHEFSGIWLSSFIIPQLWPIIAMAVVFAVFPCFILVGHAITGDWSRPNGRSNLY